MNVTKDQFVPGTIFRHYKGNLYEFICLAKNSENAEDVIVYKALYGDFGIWVRPLGMFAGQIEYQGNVVPRFSVELESFYVILSSEMVRALEDNGTGFSEIATLMPENTRTVYTQPPAGEDEERDKLLTVAIIVSSAIAVTMVIKSVTGLIKALQRKPVIIEYDELQEIIEDGKILKDASGAPVWKVTKKHQVVEFRDQKETTDISFEGNTKGVVLKYKNDSV